MILYDIFMLILYVCIYIYILIWRFEGEYRIDMIYMMCVACHCVILKNTETLSTETSMEHPRGESVAEDQRMQQLLGLSLFIMVYHHDKPYMGCQFGGWTAGLGFYVGTCWWHPMRLFSYLWTTGPSTSGGVSASGLCMQCALCCEHRRNSNWRNCFG